MKNKFRKAVALIFCAITLLMPLSTLAYAASDNTLTTSINLSMTNENLRGAGYEWKNIDDTLILNGMRLVTTDSFGIKFHSGVTVKVSGDNYISAKDNAFLCLGEITFEGDGTLTLVSGDTAIQITSSSSETVRFRSGTYSIKGNNYAISSDTATVSFAGADITVEGAKGAVRVKNVSMSGGSVNATGSITATDALTVAFTSLTAVSTSGPALHGAKKMDIQAKRITAGETLNGLIEIEKYGTEKAVKLTANSAKSTRSTLFGEKLPAFVDYLVFIFLILAVAALVGVPLLIKYKKTQKLIALNEEMKANQKKAAKAAKTPKSKKQRK